MKKDPKLQQEAEDVINQVINEEKEEVLKNKQEDENEVNKTVQDYLTNLFNKIEKNHQKEEISESSSETIHTEEYSDEEPITLNGAGVFVKVPEIPTEKHECTILLKEMILNRIQYLVVENKLMDVKVFEENIKDCKNEGSRIDAVLQFNGEACYLGLDVLNADNHTYKVLSDGELSNSFVLEDHHYDTCFLRLGTDELQMEETQ